MRFFSVVVSITLIIATTSFTLILSVILNSLIFLSLPKCVYLRNIFPYISALFYCKSEEEKSVFMLCDLEISSAKQLSPLLLNSPSLKFI